MAYAYSSSLYPSCNNMISCGRIANCVKSSMTQDTTAWCFTMKSLQRPELHGSQVKRLRNVIGGHYAAWPTGTVGTSESPLSCYRKCFINPTMRLHHHHHHHHHTTLSPYAPWNSTLINIGLIIHSFKVWSMFLPKLFWRTILSASKCHLTKTNRNQPCLDTQR